jgi:UDP-N-acetylmuramyl pentapeptide phosphotransferase/UDP-N-acetylglucosamine-1-phosphate transferase
MMIEALLFASCGILTALAVAGALPVLKRRSIIDVPGDRTNHKTPTPRGGGIALTSVVLVTAGIAYFLGLQPSEGTHLAPSLLFGGFVVLAFLSAFDDVWSLSPVVRILCQTAVVATAVLSYPADARVFDGAMPIFIERAALVIGWLWFINLYNFMDGIDGITGVETISICAGVILISHLIGLSVPVLGLLLIAGALGFLVHNWHPARIFLGDVGSVPLGFLTAALLIGLAMSGALAAALILPGYYVVDSGITLLDRLRKREKIWQAHSQHAYQRAVRRGWRHDIVVCTVAALNIVLAVLAFMSLSRPISSLCAAYALIFCVFVWFRIGFAKVPS